MKLEQTELDSGILKVSLEGSLDIAGASDIDTPFNAIGGNCDKVIVDFADVSFLASIGIRMLVKAAKAMATRGGRMVVINPSTDVRKVMETIGVDRMIPICSDQNSAIAELG